jgi:hypothetical protein
VTTRAPLAVTVSSSSPQGTLSTSPSGPWSPTLSLTIAAGTGTSGAFYYLDTRAGAQTLTASATGATSGTQIVTVTPGPVVSLAVTPATGTVRVRTTLQFASSGIDSFGNRFPVSATWSLTPRTLGTLAPSAGGMTTFTAARVLGRGTLTAAVGTETGTISAAAKVTVTPAGLSIAVLRLQKRNGAVFVGVLAVDAAGKSISRAHVFVVVRRDGRRYFSRLVTTGAAGRVSFRVPARRGGCFMATVTRVSAAGFKWDGRTPHDRLCLLRSR